MKKALISPEEAVTNTDNTSGYRVAEVADFAFEVAPPLYWLDCEDDVIADLFYFDTTTQQIQAKPILATNPQVNGQPSTTGSQSF